MTELEKIIGYEFHNPELLERALTHSSYINEHYLEKTDCLERLEFLGDAVLEVVISEFLYQTFPNKMEGEMSKLRASIVCERALGLSAEEIRIGDFLRFGRGMAIHQAKENDSITSDAFEALIAALYLDGGMEVAKKLIQDHVINGYERRVLYQDAKTVLQEILQKDHRTLSYELLEETGPDHNPVFKSAVLIDGVRYESGEGHSKKVSEMNAAFKTIERLKQEKAD